MSVRSTAIPNVCRSPWPFITVKRMRVSPANAIQVQAGRDVSKVRERRLGGRQDKPCTTNHAHCGPFLPDIMRLMQSTSDGTRSMSDPSQEPTATYRSRSD
eukprot:1162122-Pelagomonas_calceolata.AAC.1